MSHALMALWVIAWTPDEFEAWMAGGHPPRSVPPIRLERSGVATCSSPRPNAGSATPRRLAPLPRRLGTPGPDLSTHVASDARSRRVRCRTTGKPRALDRGSPAPEAGSAHAADAPAARGAAGAARLPREPANERPVPVAQARMLANDDVETLERTWAPPPGFEGLAQPGEPPGHRQALHRSPGFVFFLLAGIDALRIRSSSRCREHVLDATRTTPRSPCTARR
jgi:hypothetical protein